MIAAGIQGDEMRRTSSRMIDTNVGDRDTKSIRRKKKNIARAGEDVQDAIIPLPASCMFTDAPLDTSLLKITRMSMSTNTKSLILILPHVDEDYEGLSGRRRRY